ncbi:MAG: hypothetical protein ACI90V_007822, partial [Bacillariaceae sp.]
MMTNNNFLIVILIVLVSVICDYEVNAMYKDDVGVLDFSV